MGTLAAALEQGPARHQPLRLVSTPNDDLSAPMTMAPLTKWNLFQHCRFLRFLGSVMVLLVMALVGTTYAAVVGFTYGPLLINRNPLIVLGSAAVVVAYSLVVRAARPRHGTAGHGLQPVQAMHGSTATCGRRAGARCQLVVRA